MNTALWIAQGVLALAFFGAGMLKLVKRPSEIGAMIPILGTYTNGTLKAIGVLEVLGAIGMLAPRLTGIAPGLTPLAAVGFAFIMMSAAIAHYRRGEMADIGKNALLLALALFVAWGRRGWL